MCAAHVYVLLHGQTHARYMCRSNCNYYYIFAAVRGAGVVDRQTDRQGGPFGKKRVGGAWPSCGPQDTEHKQDGQSGCAEWVCRVGLMLLLEALLETLRLCSAGQGRMARDAWRHLS